MRTEPKPDKSIGLRLDYFVASEALVQKEHGTVPRVIDSQILSDFVALMPKTCILEPEIYQKNKKT